MRSIERRFASFQQKRPDHSTIINLAGAVRSQRFTPAMISRWFTQLVDPADYARSDRLAIIRHLVRLSNPVRTAENGAKLAS